MGWLRAGVGVALLVAPGVPLRVAGGDEPTGAALLLMRTIGIRDLVLGLGTVLATRSVDPADVGRWSAMTLASDSLDAAIGLAAAPPIGSRDAVGAASLAALFVGLGLAARRHAAGPAPAAGR
jgi:hypothetical protein